MPGAELLCIWLLFFKSSLLMYDLGCNLHAVKFTLYNVQFCEF